MTGQRFFICRRCGNIVAFIHRSGVPVVCCGENMQEIIPNSVDAAGEKHLPVISVEGNTVTVAVGSAPHPMSAEHYIQWISLECEHGNQRKELAPGDEPKAVFELSADDCPLAAYAYCNLHSLWKSEL